MLKIGYKNTFKSAPCKYQWEDIHQYPNTEHRVGLEFTIFHFSSLSSLNFLFCFLNTSRLLTSLFTDDVSHYLTASVIVFFFLFIPFLFIFFWNRISHCGTDQLYTYYVAASPLTQLVAFRCVPPCPAIIYHFYYYDA